MPKKAKGELVSFRYYHFGEPPPQVGQALITRKGRAYLIERVKTVAKKENAGQRITFWGIVAH